MACASTTPLPEESYWEPRALFGRLCCLLDGMLRRTRAKRCFVLTESLSEPHRSEQGELGDFIVLGTLYGWLVRAWPRVSQCIEARAQRAQTEQRV